jgi:hypothetical protein
VNVTTIGIDLAALPCGAEGGEPAELGGDAFAVLLAALGATSTPLVPPPVCTATVPAPLAAPPPAEAHTSTGASTEPALRPPADPAAPLVVATCGFGSAGSIPPPPGAPTPATTEPQVVPPRRDEPDAPASGSPETEDLAPQLPEIAPAIAPVVAPPPALPPAPAAAPPTPTPAAPAPVAAPAAAPVEPPAPAVDISPAGEPRGITRDAGAPPSAPKSPAPSTDVARGSPAPAAVAGTGAPLEPRVEIVGRDTPPAALGRLVAATVPQAREGSSDVRLSVRLDPPSLGHVTVDVSTRDGAVHVVVRPTESASVPVLDAQRSAVEAALANAGFDLGSFDVHSGDRRDPHHPAAAPPARLDEPEPDSTPTDDGALRL